MSLARQSRLLTEYLGRFGYTVRFLPVGPEDSALGAPTQMAIFTKEQAS